MILFTSGMQQKTWHLCCSKLFKTLLCGALFCASIGTASVQTKSELSPQEPSVFPSILLSPLLAKQINIVGGTGALHENIRLHIEQSNPNLNAINAKRRILALINRAANALGYYHLEATIKINTAEQLLDINIKPGEPVLWTAAEITADPPLSELSSVQSLLDNSSIKPGNQLNHKAYDELKANMITACKNNGYLDADYAYSGLKVDIETKKATAIFDLNCGSIYRIESESYSGSKLSRQLLEIITHDYKGKPEQASSENGTSRYNWFFRKEPVDRPLATNSDKQAKAVLRNQTVRQYYRNLSASGYFESIDISQEKINEDNESASDSRNNDKLVAIKINLVDKPKHQYLTGIGFGTDTGPRAQLSWERAILNDRGHSLSSKLELSPSIKTFQNRYRIPSPHPLFDFNEYKLAYTRESVENKTTDKTIFSHSWNYKYPSQWFQVLRLNLEHEISQVDNEQRETDTLLLPEASWSISEASPLSWIGLYQLWTSVASGQKFLGSSTAFLKAQLGTKLQIPLNNKHQLITRFEIGGIKTPDLSEVPLSQRFFTGGDQTVRGYDFQELGQSQTDNDVEGGKYLNVSSLEHNYLFRPNWRTALFLDGGRAYSNMDQRFAYSMGIGVRWLSPVGQLRLDIARPIDDPQASSFRLHFFLGGEL